ncbi:MAG: DUF1566 domain-containing protein [bacterium]
MKTKLQTALFLIFLSASLASGQTDIRREVLGDKVERYYRPKTAGQKPWFFQQVENLFNIILPSKDQLPFGVSVAFLVGVSQYDNLSPQLPFVKNDLSDMREFLLNQGGFDTVYVAREKIVNRDLIEDYMRNKFARGLNNRDRLLFYYSGHGADFGGKTGYMQFAGARSDRFVSAQLLAIQEASNWCSEMNLGHLLLVFDCCASGLAFTPKGEANEVNALLATLSRNGSRAVMTAGTADEKTYEVERRDGKGNGVFTRAFLNAAATGLADKGDGFMTVDEIYARLKDEIARFSVQYRQSLTPKLWALDEAQYRGTFVLVNPEAKTRRITLAEAYSQPLNARPRGEVVPGAAYGIIRLISYIAGEVLLDGAPIGEVDKGGERYFYTIAAGKHALTVKGVTETGTENITITKGETTPVIILAKAKQPLVENKPAASTAAPRYALRRDKKENLSDDEVKKMLTEKRFFDSDWNKTASGAENNYEVKTLEGEKVVIDSATGLMWQQGGSPEYMTYEKAKAHIAQLNKDGFAGFSDWRLPTLEEAMSLMEPSKNSDGLYIDSKFDEKQTWIWTSDTYSAGRA